MSLTNVEVEESQLRKANTVSNVSPKNYDHESVSNRSKSREVSDDEDTTSYPDGGLKAYSVVVGSFFGSIVILGIVNSIGAIQAYVSTHQLADVKATSVSWIFSVYLALAYALSIVIGPIFDRYGSRKLMSISTVMIFAGLMATANSTKVWQFILSFICLGIGNGIGLSPVIGVINHWFLKKRGTCTGIASSGGSVGGLVMPLLLRHLYSAFGFVWAIRVLAFFCLACMLIATVLCEERFKNTPVKARGGMKNKNKYKNVSNWISDLVVKKSKDKTYIFLVVGGFFAELSLILTVTYFSTYAIAQGVSESTSYLLLTVWNATGIAGRWIPPIMSDFWGKFNVNIAMLFGFNLCILVMWLPFGHHLKVLFAYASLGGYFSGSVLTMLPICLAQISPVDLFGENFGFLFFFLSFGNLIGVPVAASIINKGTVHDYDMFVVLVACASTCGTIFWALSRYMIVGSKLNVRV